MREGVSQEFRLDPRTKLLFLITMTMVAFSADGDGVGIVFTVLLGVLPFVVLVLYKAYDKAAQFIASYIILHLVSMYLYPYMRGPIGMVTSGMCGIFSRMMPCFIAGYIFIRTTKINELISAMNNMHVPMKIWIPVSVLFRFFPTLREEYRAISNAMKMRGIYFGGKHPTKIVEYRMIPFLLSSVRIGEELSAAALTRGLGAPVQRTNICELKFGIADYVVCILCTGMCLAFLYLNFR